jgi:hypothetical protein
MPYKTGTPHDAVLFSAELTRQNAIAAAGNSQGAAKTADINFARTVLASALANNIAPGAALEMLAELGLRS